MKKILLSFICLLAATGAFALAQINVSFHNIQIINAGASATVEVWAAAGPGYVSQDGSTTNPDGSWVTLQVRFDMNIPGTTTLQSGSVARNTSVTTGGSFQNNILPFGSSTTNADGGITFNNSNNSAGDLTATPIRLGTVTLNFTGGTVTAANILTPRQSDNSTLPNPTSFWTTNGAPAAQNPIGLVALTPLPVKLLSFDAKKATGNRSQINWQTAQETGTDYFEVERSLDGKEFNTSIRRMTAAGNSVTALDYQTYDNSPAVGANYYRLKLVDVSGKYSYSEVRTVIFEGAGHSYTLTPNPAKEFVMVKGMDAGASIMILSTTGQVISTTKATGTSETINLNMVPGTYYVQIVQDGSIVYNTKFTKQ